jgi:hypothetical protein
MAKTELHNYTVQEKLNKMDIDLVDISVSTDADASGEPLVIVTEIPNAVSVPGGTAILQSAMWLDNRVVLDTVDIIITSDETQLTSATGGGNTAITVTESVLVTALDTTAAIMDGTCGHFQINNMFDAGVVSIGSKQNIGMVCKAAAGSTSLHFWMISNSSTDYLEGTGVLRLGFVKD